MTEFQQVKIPEGDLVQVKGGKPVVGDRPIIGSLRGDGIGLDITPTMKKVVGAAVERAFGGKREIQWCPLFCGLEGLHHYGEVLPKETVEAIQYLKIAIKGPFTTPIGEETHVCLYCAHQQYHPGTCDKCSKEDQKTAVDQLKERKLPVAFPIMIINDEKVIQGFKKDQIVEALGI